MCDTDKNLIKHIVFDVMCATTVWGLVNCPCNSFYIFPNNSSYVVPVTRTTLDWFKLGGGLVVSAALLYKYS